MVWLLAAGNVTAIMGGTTGGDMSTMSSVLSRLDIPEVCLISPKRFYDERGYFSEVYSEAAFREIGIETRFVQDNQSFSRDKGVVRGLHFQIPPFAQAKLIRVLRGSIFDVVVDLRPESPSFGRSISAILSAEDGTQLFVPEGFAHGLCTLEPDTEIFYKVTAPYAPDCDRGLLWHDPYLEIDWPVDRAAAIVSPRDRTHPRFRELPPYFTA